MTYISHKLQRSHEVTCRMVLRAAVAITVERGRGQPISLPDLERRLPFAKSTIWRALCTLRDKYGYVDFQDGGQHTIRVTEQY
jgi:uncharacterized membrane protein